MLVLTRKSGEDIFLDDEIRVVIKEIKGKQVRVGIEAPPHISVYRGEIYRQIQAENLRALSGDFDYTAEAAELLSQLTEEPEKEE